MFDKALDYIIAGGYPKDIVKDYLDTDILSVNDIRSVKYDDIKNYEYKYPNKNIVNMNDPILHYLFILFCTVIVISISVLLGSLFILLFYIATTLILIRKLYITSYNINVIEKRRRIK